MIETKDISKMVRHIVRRKRGIADPQIMHPMREWVIGIAVTAIVIIAGSILAAILYNYYDDKRDAIIEVNETPLPYNAGLVETALTEYRQKQQQYNQIVGTSIPVTSTTETNEETASTTDILPNDTPQEEIQIPEIIQSEIIDTDELVAPDLAI